MQFLAIMQPVDISFSKNTTDTLESDKDVDYPIHLEGWEMEIRKKSLEVPTRICSLNTESLVQNKIMTIIHKDQTLQEVMVKVKKRKKRVY